MFFTRFWWILSGKYSFRSVRVLGSSWIFFFFFFYDTKCFLGFVLWLLSLRKWLSHKQHGYCLPYWTDRAISAEGCCQGSCCEGGVDGTETCLETEVNKRKRKMWRSESVSWSIKDEEVSKDGGGVCEEVTEWERVYTIGWLLAMYIPLPLTVTLSSVSSRPPLCSACDSDVGSWEGGESWGPGYADLARPQASPQR